jgi:hypothetical protein
LLNRIGIATGHGNAWTQERVRGFRNHYEIDQHLLGDRGIVLSTGMGNLVAGLLQREFQLPLSRRGLARLGAHAAPWRHQGPASLPWCSMGDQD